MEAYVYLRSSQPEAEAMLRTELKQLDPNVALTDVRTLARQVEDARETSRTSAAAAVGAAGRRGDAGARRDVRRADDAGRTAAARVRHSLGARRVPGKRSLAKSSVGDWC